MRGGATESDTAATTQGGPTLPGLTGRIPALSVPTEPPRATSTPAGVGLTGIKLGHVEEAILRELRRTGGPVPRALLLGVVYKSSRPVRPTGRFRGAAGDARQVPHGPVRANAEATLSRALRSLDRKGLILRTDNWPTRQLLISLANPPAPPAWERDARADESLAARWDTIAAGFVELARRARERAIRLRMERRSTSMVRQRDRDVAQAHLMMTGDFPGNACQGGHHPRNDR